MNRDIVSNPSKQEVPEKVIPIVFSTNDNYAPYAGVAIRSIVLNADPHCNYRIYVLYDSLSAKHAELLESLATENISVQCLNIEQHVRGIQSPLPLVGLISKEAYYRILIPEIEEFKAYPYVVYLDCDLIVNSDIAGIIPQDMGDKLLAGVVDYPMMKKEDKTRLKEDFQLDAAQYINSGVLVFNVPQWIQENTSKKCFDFLRRAVSTKYVYMDQDILNVVCRDRIYYLDDPWNYNWSWRFRDRETIELCKAAVDRVGENFHILHFTMSTKPWNTLEHPYSHYFWKYAAQTPFLEEIIKTNLCSKATEKELQDVHNSVSFRVGRAIIWAPRKVRGGLRCCRDHGVGYTVRRTLYHIGLWEDEENPSYDPSKFNLRVPDKLSGGVQCYRDHGAGYTVRRTLYHLGLWEDEEAPKGPENRPKLFRRIERNLHPTKAKQEGSGKETGNDV